MERNFGEKNSESFDPKILRPKFFTEALEDETTKKRFPKNINFILRSHC